MPNDCLKVPALRTVLIISVQQSDQLIVLQYALLPVWQGYSVGIFFNLFFDGPCPGILLPRLGRHLDRHQQSNQVFVGG